MIGSGTMKTEKNEWWVHQWDDKQEEWPAERGQRGQWAARFLSTLLCQDDTQGRNVGHLDLSMSTDQSLEDLEGGGQDSQGQ
jgi:hypothetical protein